MSELRSSSKSKKWIIFVVLGVVIIAITVFVVFFVSNAVKISKSRNEINAAAKYLDDLDYEEAIAHYLNAIELNHSNLEAYSGIYEAYIALAEAAIAQMDYEQAIDYYNEAIDILREGREYIHSGALDDMIDELRDAKKAAKEQLEKDSSSDDGGEPAENGEDSNNGIAANNGLDDEDIYANETEQGRVLLQYGYPMTAYYYNALDYNYKVDEFDGNGNIITTRDYTIYGPDMPDEYHYSYEDDHVLKSYIFYPMGSSSIREEYVYEYTYIAGYEKQLDKYLYLRENNEYIYADEHAIYYYLEDGELSVSIYTTYMSNGNEKEVTNTFLHGYLISYSFGEFNGAGNHGSMRYFTYKYEEYDGPLGHCLRRSEYDENGIPTGFYAYFYQ